MGAIGAPGTCSSKQNCSVEISSLGPDGAALVQTIQLPEEDARALVRRMGIGPVVTYAAPDMLGENSYRLDLPAPARHPDEGHAIFANSLAEVIRRLQGRFNGEFDINVVIDLRDGSSDAVEIRRAEDELRKVWAAGDPSISHAREPSRMREGAG